MRKTTELMDTGEGGHADGLCTKANTTAATAVIQLVLISVISLIS